MPHVVLEGSADLASLGQALEPFMERSENRVLKTTRIYVAQDGTSLLLDALSVEEDRQIPFFVLVDEREDGLVVRLHPRSDVEKTDGVKQLLASVALRLVDAEPGLSVGETNLDAYLQTA